MSTKTEARPTDTPTDTDELDHFECCEDGPQPTFCGAPSQPYGGEVDEVSCVVCTDLLHVGFCPVKGRCPWA